MYMKIYIGRKRGLLINPSNMPLVPDLEVPLPGRKRDRDRLLRKIEVERLLAQSQVLTSLSFLTQARTFSL
jgi:hypothetical protein